MKKVVIVGGNSGIGLSFVQKFNRKHQIVCLNRKGFSEDLNVEQHTFDVLTDEFPVQDHFDSLIYCPGSINLKPFKNLTDQDFKNDMDINFNGAVKCIKSSLPLLNKNGISSIVLFSTIAVAQGMPFHASIASAKGAVEALAKSLAAEFAPHIRVNVVAPSVTKTEMFDQMEEKARNTLIESSALKRVAEPIEIANLVAFLSSNLNTYITGQNIIVDGGFSVT